MDALARLRVVTEIFEDELRGADLDAKTAGTRWTAAQLAAHLGEVHRWAANNARHGPRQTRTNVPELEVSAVEWYSGGRAELLAALEELDPEQRCRTLSPTDKTVRFWHRRQLHEVVVHLWDLRSAADPAAPPPGEVDAGVYADGVDELFELFVRRGERRPLSEALALRATDLDREWVIQPDWTLGGTAGAGVSATAGELMLFAWNRVEAGAGFAVEASPALLREFRGARVSP